MPTYVYRCPDGHEFETFHKMSEDGPASCEECDKSPVERVLFPVAVHFKGSGFYATDYGRGNRKGEGGEGEGTSSEGGDDKKSGEKAETAGSSSGASEGSSDSKSSDSSNAASKDSSGTSSEGKGKKKSSES